jgi:hypothetical protein
MKMVLFTQVGLGFSPDVEAEAATHVRLAFNPKRKTFIFGAGENKELQTKPRHYNTDEDGA